MSGLKKLAERIPVWVRNTEANRIALARQRKEANIKRMTCKELKSILVEHTQPVTGKKADLIERYISVCSVRGYVCVCVAWVCVA